MRKSIALPLSFAVLFSVASPLLAEAASNQKEDGLSPIIGAVIAAIATVIVGFIGLFSMFGDKLFTRWMANEQAKQLTNLETFKANYQLGIERLKTELERAKAVTLRYSEGQFTLYDKLWGSLADLQSTADELWARADLPTLKKFGKQLSTARATVSRGALLIEAEHFEELQRIFNAFENFKTGKLSVVDLVGQSENAFRSSYKYNELQRQIEENRDHKQEFDQMLTALLASFRKQIKGETDPTQ